MAIRRGEEAAANPRPLRRSSREDESFEDYTAGLYFGKGKGAKAYQKLNEAHTLYQRLVAAERERQKESVLAGWKETLKACELSLPREAVDIVRANRRVCDAILHQEMASLAKEKNEELEALRKKYDPREEKRKENEECFAQRLEAMKAEVLALKQRRAQLEKQIAETTPAMKDLAREVGEMRELVEEMEKQRAATQEASAEMLNDLEKKKASVCTRCK